ncbi:MAG: hypothetical protein Q4B09_04815 [Lachnospiraceae bacterium]|nr:hypothetical protein [Lachnospiraceae bacterium]
MKERKTFGFCLVVLAAVLGIVSLVRFQMWAPSHNGSDTIITAALVIAILLDICLMIRDSSFAIILATVGYTVAGVKLLTNSVGSFVDAFQGINMFGDATQVGSIISIAAVILVCVLLSIIASFMTRVKA